MNESTPLVQADLTSPNHTNYRQTKDIEQNEYYEYESTPHNKCFVILYSICGALITAGAFYFLGFYLPNMFLPVAQALEPLRKVAALDVQLHPYLATPHGTSRLVLIGDIHGQFNELQKLLKQMAYSRKRDTVVLLGDFISKGPDSFKMLDWAEQNNIKCILGNHELNILDIYTHYHRLDPLVFEASDANSISLPVNLPPGMSVMRLDEDPEFLLARRLEPRHVKYLNSCPIILKLGPVAFRPSKSSPYDTDPTLFSGSVQGVAVHGGLNPSIVSLEEQDPWDVVSVRDLVPPFFNETSELPLEDGVSWTSKWKELQQTLSREKQMVVYYGHDAHRGLRLKSWSKGLDLGCNKGKQLSALTVWAEEGKKKKGGKHQKREVVYKDKLYQVEC
ncbi:hypothetical protein BABINDRAFT_162169 [Babjeviella inositovora NRRL Y-12698]|uniref:Calcineurin-like phosphoesterase domain-containing protein n=1 Tax=Babjeviella inositovora NRRL Y-12698 TaxID=984486 RepID=A0A1E3QNT3_9ASCO|nr:uncharacterized protein BABINDRAFT_162169 [Babjeviella inositovora NRRL Y-12698]ODQ79104.1 hypothetical protein BABINDRAFT_162169 [Babjeviella inositovora NRRL Y-12698]